MFYAAWSRPSRSVARAKQHLGGGFSQLFVWGVALSEKKPAARPLQHLLDALKRSCSAPGAVICFVLRSQPSRSHNSIATNWFYLRNYAKRQALITKVVVSAPP